MENLGQYLRSKREERNLSVEAVHAEIRMTVEHINAMENNQLTVLGNYGFARSMVYTYARFLEAEEHIVMNLFDIVWPSSRQTNFTPKLPIKEKKVLISINFIWLISIIIFTVVLSSIIWISYTKGYLKRPFDRQAETADTINVKTAAKPLVEKPDTLRQRMLELTQNQGAQSTEKATVKAKPAAKRKATSDATDYVDDLIFGSGESPFNQRF